MQNKRKILLVVVVAVLLTLISLSYESTYYWYNSSTGDWLMSPSWGFPFQYVFDTEVSSPVHGINIEDRIEIFPLISNVYVYFAILYFTILRK